MPERIALVTGAHGFLGRHVARALSLHGYLVHGLGHGGWEPEEWKRCGLSSWRTVEVTVETLRAFPTPELIVHCAGGASVALSVADPLLDFRRTVTSTASVLEFARQHAPSTAMVLPSTGSVYGSCEDGSVPESAPLAPQSPHASHKQMAEALCTSFGRSYGVRSSVVRFFSIYGPGLRKQLLWDACTRLSRGEASFAGTGGETRDFLHVDDATQLILCAIGHAAASSPVVNGGTGVGATVSEMVTALADALGARQRPMFTKVQRSGDPFRFVADNTRARGWGWTPRVSWQDGVRAYAAWFAAGAK